MIGYLFFRFFVFIFGLLPFKVIYWLSDGVAFLLRNVFKYRRKVVEKQLRDSFPDKSDDEIKAIVKKTYKNLADIMLESIKGFTISEKEIRSRYKFTNPEVINKITDQGRSVIMAAAHYNNWEWGAFSVPIWLSGTGVGFYKPLANKYIDRYGKENRSRLGLILASIGDTARIIDKYKDKNAIFVLIADQHTWSKGAHWINFLGRETPCHQGIDKYSRMLKMPVFYADISRIKRGYYEVTLIPLTDGKQDLPEGAITKIFMKELENRLHEKPENWLWSHKRWKRQRKPDEKLLS